MSDCDTCAYEEKEKIKKRGKRKNGSAPSCRLRDKLYGTFFTPVDVEAANVFSDRRRSADFDFLLSRIKRENLERVERQENIFSKNKKKIHFC